MKMFLFLFILIYFSTSCNKIKSEKAKCIYFIDDLIFKDSSRIVISKSRTLNMQDVFEKDNNSKEGSLYQFDSNNQLRFYAFVYNDSNEYSFSIKYDSLGNIVKKTGGDVIKWVADRHGSDSTDLTFLLYNIGTSYDQVRMIVGNDTFKNIKLFKSRIFSNLIGGMIKIQSKNIAGNRINLLGLKRNYCAKETTIFRDSVLIELPEK